MIRKKSQDLGKIPSLVEEFHRRVNLINSGQVSEEIFSDFIFGLKRLFKGFPIPEKPKNSLNSFEEKKRYPFPSNDPDGEEQD